MLAVLGELISLIASDTRQEEPGSAAVGVRRLSRAGGSLPPHAAHAHSRILPSLAAGAAPQSLVDPALP